MYKQILVATDGSPHAEDAVRRAIEMAAAIGLARVHLISACHPYTLGELERIRADLPAEFRDLVDSEIEGETHVANAAVIAHREGIEPITHVASGDPADAILRTAADIGADLIVVGARGLNTMERFVRGSTSTRVAHHSPCDVLIVEHDG